jgi:hypothetical protein
MVHEKKNTNTKLAKIAAKEENKQSPQSQTTM